MVRVKVNFNQNNTNLYFVDFEFLNNSMMECLDKYVEIINFVKKKENKIKNIKNNLLKELNELNLFIYEENGVKKLAITIFNDCDNFTYIVDIFVDNFVNFDNELKNIVNMYKQKIDKLYEEFCLIKLKVVSCEC